MLEPYQQGELDNLCGIYAIVNASLWGLRNERPLSDKECKVLFYFLAQSADSTGLLNRALKRGLTTPKLSNLLKQTQSKLQDQFGVELTIKKPFHGRKCVSMDTMEGFLGNAFAEPNSAIITLIAGRLKHWTVPTRLNNRSIRVFDSLGYERLPRADCGCTTDKATKERRFHIKPASVFQLSFSKSA